MARIEQGCPSWETVVAVLPVQGEARRSTPHRAADRITEDDLRGEPCLCVGCGGPIRDEAGFVVGNAFEGFDGQRSKLDGELGHRLVGSVDQVDGPSVRALRGDEHGGGEGLL